MTQSASPEIVSADSHVFEPVDLWARTIGAEFGDRTPRPVAESGGVVGEFFFNGSQVLPVARPDSAQAAPGVDMQRVGWDPQERLRFQDQAGVSAEVLNPTRLISILRSPDKPMVQAAASVYNDWIADFCSGSGGRLVGAGVVPLSDPVWAARELTRNRGRGLTSAVIPLEPAPSAAPYRDAVYDRVWASAVDSQLPVVLHELTGNSPSPFNFKTERELEEAPKAMLVLGLEIMYVLANDFIFGGILDRYPDLKLVCSEFEISWLPYFMYRIDHIQISLASRLKLKPTELPASEYVKSRIWHGLIDDPNVVSVAEVVGASRLMWGSDFPHIRSVGVEARAAVEETLAGLSDDAQRAVAASSARELFGTA